MALFISNEDVLQLITPAECVDVLDDLFKQEARGLVENLPRRRENYGKASFTLMGGTALGSQAYAVRQSELTLLFNTDTGKIDAAIQPSALARIRTGAASGLATRYMAPPDATVVGMIGTGRQATAQLQAILAVRPITRVKVFSRTADKRTAYAKEAEDELGIEVVPVASSTEAVRGSAIVVTITNSREPVFDGADLEPGTHINAAGSNGYARRELDLTTIQRADLIAIDNVEQAKTECGELMWAVERGVFRWPRAVPLHQVVSGLVSGRPSPEAITLFESQGVGIEDTAASAYVLKKARERGMGQELPF